MKSIFSKKLLFITLGSLFVFGSIITTHLAVAENGCQIESAVFNPSGFQAGPDRDNDGDPDGFYDEGSDIVPGVSIIITTLGCAGEKIEFSLVEDDLGFSDDVDGSAFENHELIVPESNQIIIQAGAGEDECGILSTPDCQYYLEVGPESDLLSWSYSSKGKPDGELSYNCDTTCDDEWRYLSDTSVTENGTPVYPTEEALMGVGSGPCYDEAAGDYMDDCYEIISGLPILNEVGERLDAIKDTKSLTGVFNQIYTIAIGVAGILAVVMMIFHAWEYLTTESITTKALLKDKLLKIVLGILLLFGSVIILRTINPDILKLDPGIGDINLSGTGGDSNDGLSVSQNYTAPTDTLCPTNGGASEISDIIASLNGKVTYRLGGKGGPAPYPADNATCSDGQPCQNFCPSETICLDCSGFVNYIYHCAGIPTINGGTATIFGSTNDVLTVKNLTTTSVTVLGTNGDENLTLQVGDLLGWPPANGKAGHVIMYVGNGQAAESTSGQNGRDPGKSLKIASVLKYKNKIKYIRPIEH